MGKKLYIHVGPPKTGTKAIQQILAEQDNSEVMYPKVGLAPCGAHHNLLWSVRGKGGPSGYVATDPKLLFDKIAECTRSNLNVVISSETMLPMVSSTRAEKSLKETLGTFIRALLPHVSGQVDEVEILVSCREHYERASSYYSLRLQNRLGASLDITPDEFLMRFVSDLCYAGKLKALQNTGFKVKVLNYHPRQDWIKRFLTYIGFSEHRIPEPPAKNISLSPKALIAKLAANRVLKFDRDVNQFVKRLKTTPGFHAPARQIFGEAAVAAVERKFATDRRFLRDEYGINLVPPEPDAQENMFFLDRHSLGEIARAAQVLGSQGELIVKAAGEFLRE